MRVVEIGDNQSATLWESSDSQIGIWESGLNLACKHDFFAQCYPPLDSCCGDVTVEIEPDGTQPGRCCYNVYIKTEDTTSCMPLFFRAWDLYDIDSLHSKIAEDFYANGIDGDPRGRKFGPYCIHVDAMDAIKVDVFFVREGDTTVCENTVIADSTCPLKELCCDSATVEITKQPDFDNGTSCCFDLEVHRDSSIACDSLMIEVWDESIGAQLDVTPDSVTIPPGESHFQLCLNKTDFHGDSTLDVTVKFVNSYGWSVCYKQETLIACQEISGCTPDYTEFQWKEPADTLKNLTYICPDEPYDTCNIKLIYTYRHVTNNDTSIHRDIQVLSWEMGCNCDIENFTGDIIAKIWNNDEVKHAFWVDTSSIAPGSTKCFTNFRVVTSDCWKYVMPHPCPDGSYFGGGTVRCNDTICCYQTYMVCYLKRISDGKMVLDSVARLDSLAQTPDTCAIHCHPDNCEIWSPPGNSVIDTGPIGKFSVGNFLEFITEGCDIKISNTDDGNILDISLRCDEKGTGEVQIFDLYGNLISQEEFHKKSYEMNVRYNLGLHTGIYFCMVKFNNQIFAYKKIMIIK